MTTPARGVFSISEPPNFGPVEYGFHATADAARRFRLVGPDGLENLNDQVGVDLANVAAARWASRALIGSWPCSR